VYEQQHNIALSGLQLDEADVPRRGASRANSVRFDDSATTNHWIHDSPGNSDYFQRPVGGIGGYAMTERSSSHKSDNRSDGRQSLRSFGEGASSLYEGDQGAGFRPPTRGSDILDSCLHRASAPRAGPAPAVIRCWLDAPSTYEPLLYAVVCTGSARSSVEMSLIAHLGLHDRISLTSSGDTTIELAVVLPDAIVQQHSRITGPSELPRLTVEFAILPVRAPKSKEGEKIRIFIGSDVIASHMGDVLFSQSKIFLYVDDGRKVFVPFIRPEAEETFGDIFTAHSRHYEPKPDDANNISLAISGEGETAAGFDATGGDRSHISVSSPRPVIGSQAPALRGVAAMEPPDFTQKESLPAPPPQQEKQFLSVLTATDADSAYHHQHQDSWNGTSRKEAASTRDLSSSPAADNEESTSPLSGGGGGGKGITRGRSLTNPYEDTPSGPAVPKPPPGGGKVWKPTNTGMTYSAPLKDPLTPTSSGASRGSSRGMKVLRTSKSFSATGTSASATEKSQTATKYSTFKPQCNHRGHNRTMSGGDAIVGGGGMGGGGGKGTLVRTKSSNVVGGATAFHWMAPKAAAAE